LRLKILNILYKSYLNFIFLCVETTQPKNQVKKYFYKDSY
jgi:hypothetical protein